MAQSLTKNYLHITFSTKYREHSLQKDDLPELFSYMSGILSKLDCSPIIIGGVTDHIHVFCVLSKNITLAKMMETLKSNSSKWIKTKGESYTNFHWQDGYGAFSVSQSKVEVVRNYIQNQEQHHQQKSFQEELLKFLDEYQIEYNEDYLWN